MVGMVGRPKNWEQMESKQSMLNRVRAPKSLENSAAGNHTKRRQVGGGASFA